MRALAGVTVLLVGILAGAPAAPVPAGASGAGASGATASPGRAAGDGLLPPLPGGTEGSPTGDRPYRLVVPRSYDPGRPAPLVVLLHGYSSSGAQQDAYFRLTPLAEQEGFLLATPDGTRDRAGNRFWNATDACCDFYASGVDDVAYLDALIDEVAAGHAVDPRRVYLVGHSNGAFMSHRYACDRSERVAAIVTLAGMQWSDETRCEPATPVSVLHVHGRDDEVVDYDGGRTPVGAYPGAEATVAAWAGENGCTATVAESDGRLDVEAGIPGEETVVARVPGCGTGSVELWTIENGRHVPTFNEAWAPSIWRFLAAHPKG